MGILTYATTVSLDGYVADATGDFQWGAPGPEVFAVHTQRIQEVSTEILGRHTYELMRYWHAQPNDAAWSPDEAEFASLWQQIHTVAVSSTLTANDLASTRDTLLPTLSTESIQKIVAEAPGVVEIFGPTTAAPAIRAGLVEVYEFFVTPIVLGGGLRALPADAHLNLTLEHHHVFDDGTVHLRYVPAVEGAGG